jgi:hypothetical protein
MQIITKQTSILSLMQKVYALTKDKHSDPNAIKWIHNMQTAVWLYCHKANIIKGIVLLKAQLQVLNLSPDKAIAITEALTSIESQLNKTQGDSFESQNQMIVKAFDKTFQKIGEIGGEGKIFLQCYPGLQDFKACFVDLLLGAVEDYTDINIRVQQILSELQQKINKDKQDFYIQQSSRLVVFDQQVTLPLIKEVITHRSILEKNGASIIQEALILKQNSQIKVKGIEGIQISFKTLDKLIKDGSLNDEQLISLYKEAEQEKQKYMQYQSLTLFPSDIPDKIILELQDFASVIHSFDAPSASWQETIINQSQEEEKKQR